MPNSAQDLMKLTNAGTGVRRALVCLIVWRYSDRRSRLKTTMEAALCVSADNMPVITQCLYLSCVFYLRISGEKHDFWRNLC